MTLVKQLCAFFKEINFGVDKGSILSPILFAAYLDDKIDHRITVSHNYIILNADDILLVSSSVNELRKLIAFCEWELT